MSWEDSVIEYGSVGLVDCDEVEYWTDTDHKLPEAGRLIVKRWKSGSVWAGKYTGSAKDTSFDSWRYI